MTLFVAGAHGAGKTYLAKPAAEKLNLLHVSASQLIRSELGQGSWDNERRVSGIDTNQAALIRAVARHRRQGTRLLLDGHFVLRVSAGVHEAIPARVFRDIDVTGVLLVEADASEILARLRARNDLSWTEEEIVGLANKEVRGAVEICAQLEVPLLRLRCPTHQEFDAALAELASSTE